MPVNFSIRDSLFLNGIIDSFGLFSFIQALQAHFSVAVDNREIHLGNFETIENIVQFIELKAWQKKV